MAEEAKKEDAAAQGAGDEAEALAKSKKKRLLIFGLLGVLVVAGGGGGAAFFLMSGDAHDAGGETEHAEPAEGEHAEAAEGGHSAEAGEAKGGEHAAPAAEHGGGEGERKAEGGHGGGEGEAGGKAAPPPPDPGAGIDFGDTFKLEPFNLNLGNPLENRYVRMEIALEYRGGEGQKVEIEKRLPQLRDAVVSIVSRKTREFLLAPDGKDQLRKEIQTRINRYMAKPIDNVYITDILIE